ncbi:hypothetical protein LCY76_20535 [Fictibacillus sp. KIGAM418]|uniref:Uncharacterized protein n=1 Tax=Fictibacillus marinisediminis TaxID=2878389 RepID=A0A9X1XDP9_9BACL|nr:hypothetical protein [Fictibacillus marinisediminis]MCK6258962.1 hypothetical protein [Fictibacillus marinisediminis]
MRNHFDSEVQCITKGEVPEYLGYKSQIGELMVINDYNYELMFENQRIFEGNGQALSLFVSSEDITIGQTLYINSYVYFIKRGELINKKNEKNLIKFYLEASN